MDIVLNGFSRGLYPIAFYDVEVNPMKPLLAFSLLALVTFILYQYITSPLGPDMPKTGHVKGNQTVSELMAAHLAPSGPTQPRNKTLYEIAHLIDQGKAFPKVVYDCLKSDKAPWLKFGLEVVYITHLTTERMGKTLAALLMDHKPPKIRSLLIETMRYRKYAQPECLEALRYIWLLDEFSEEGKEAKAVFLSLVPPEQLGVRKK